MLTEAEKKWLYSRENVEMVTGTYLCQFCQYMDDELEECIFRRCPKFEPDFRDAAEFEARVAARLAARDYIDLCADRGECEAPHFEKYNTKTEFTGCNMCAHCVVRLAVEEERENGRTF